MSPSAFAGVCAALALLLVACGGTAPGEVPLRGLDFERFRDEVQPLYKTSCGNPGCHGRAERPLSLYTSLGWRADPARTFLVEPLSEEELRHNFEVSRAFATDGAQPRDTLLLRKPLAEHAGTYHGGGAIFDGVGDPDHLVLERWLLEEWE